MTEESNFNQIMKDYFEKSKPPTLKERFEEYLTNKVDWAQSTHVTANELVNIVKEFLPKEDSQPTYVTMQWNKCIQNMKDRLR